MSQEIITKEQSTLIDKSKSYLDASEKSAQHLKAYSFLAGRSLQALKESTPHGQFVELATKNFPQHATRTLQVYMQFAEALNSKNAIVALLPEDRLLSESSLTVKEVEAITAAVDKVTGNKGLVETIREFQKKKNKKPRGEPTPEEAVAAEVKACESMAGDIIATIGVFIGLGDATLTTAPIFKCSPAKREELLDWSVKLNNAIRDLQKGKGKK